MRQHDSEQSNNWREAEEEPSIRDWNCHTHTATSATLSVCFPRAWHI